MIYAVFFLGMVIMGGLVFFIMPKMMFVTKQSKYNFLDTVKKLEKSILDNNWGHRGTWHVHNDFKEKEIEFKPRIANVNLCKAPYAAEILNIEKHRFSAALMPCAFSVWEDDDGKAYVTKMNTGLMGPMFGGAIARIMGKVVSKEEKQILKNIVYA